MTRRDPYAEITPMPDPDHIPDLDAVLAERARRVAMLRDAGSAIARRHDVEEDE